MEESEKRRERLKAMRAAADADADADADAESSQQGETLIINNNYNNNSPLANPFVDYPKQLLPPPPPLPRFDFYTDPLSSFSSHKPLRPPSPGPRNSVMSQSGAHQLRNSYAQHQNIHQGGVPYYNPTTTATPVGGRSPYHGHQVRGPCYSPAPTTGPMMGFRSPFPVHQGSPSFSPSPYNAPQFHNNPSPGLRRGGSVYPDHQGCPNLRPHAQGRGQWPNNSRSPSSGRGRRQSNGSRYSGGRGRGNAYEGDTGSYYDKSMVEDPWKFLEPVIWESGDNARFFNSWGSVKLTSSKANVEPHGHRGSSRMYPSAKKARVSNMSRKSSSEPSLAEFLAAAADEADGDNP